MKRILLALFVAVAVQAQDNQDFFPGGTYDPNIPSPASILGYRIGERFTQV